MGRLDGKVALITAAGPNNGGTIAAMFAGEGARIVVNDINGAVAKETADHLTGLGYEAIHTVGDVADEAAVRAMVAAAVQQFGHINVLVSLAGPNIHQGVLDFETETFERELRIYLTGAAMVMRETANRLVERGDPGSFILIGSDAGYQGQPHRIGYSTVKSGLLNMTRSAAAELAEYGIRVNLISPAGMEHNLWRSRRMIEEGPRRKYGYTRQESLDSFPIGRWIRSTDLGWLAVYLASDESEAITGVNIPVDGGSGSRYNPWIPGRDRDLSVDEYIKTRALYQRYGQTIMGPGVDLDKVPFPD